MNTKRRKVSIGIPVYNGEHLLPRAIDSLLNQTYADFEIIISDNASSDGTQAIGMAYAEADERIRYIRQEKNLGAVPNFNLVFELSDSDYFKWAAADDYIEPTYLEKTVKILDENPEVVWCHTRSSHVDAAGELLVDANALDVSYRDRENPNSSARFAAVVLGTQGCLDTYGLIRSDAIKKTPLYLPYYGTEKIFVAELALLGRYKEVPETLFFAGVHAKSSGTLETAEDQQYYADTSKKSARPPVRLAFLNGYLSAIARSSPGLVTTLSCAFTMLRWVFQVSKWKTVLHKAISGKGVGGANIERVKRLKEMGRAVDHSQMDVRAEHKALNGGHERS